MSRYSNGFSIVNISVVISIVDLIAVTKPIMNVLRPCVDSCSVLSSFVFKLSK